MNNPGPRSGSDTAASAGARERRGEELPGAYELYGVPPEVEAPARRFTREQRTTVINGILCIVLVIVILQLWLLIATMNAHLGGDTTVIWPAAAVSFVCLLLNAGLLRFVYLMERPDP